MKFVTPLTETEKKQLNELFNQHPSPRVRKRAHCILLSDRRFSIDEIARIYQVDRDTISRWLDRWKNDGSEGLTDKPRSGRPPELFAKEREFALAALKVTGFYGNP